MLNYQLAGGIEEAVSVLAADIDGTLIVGGGTTTIPSIAAGDSGYRCVLDISGLALDGIDSAGEQVEIGAGVTVAKLARDESLSALSAAASGIGGPALRNMATVGGNLCWRGDRGSRGDLSAAFLALGAQVALQTAQGEQWISLESYYIGEGRGHLVSAARFPHKALDGFGFYKLGRRKLNSHAVVSAAIAPSDSGALIVLVGADEGPVCLRVGRELLSSDVTTESVQEAIVGQLKGVPPTDYHATSEYRQQIIPLVIKRAIQASFA